MRFQRPLVWLVLLGLGFVLGVTAERLDAEPATTLRAVLAAGEATIIMLVHATGATLPASRGDRAVTDPPGAKAIDPAAMAPGLTALAVGPGIEILRADGSSAYRWQMPLDQLFTVPALLDPADVQVSGFDLLPDGGVLALLRDERHFPAFHWEDTAENTVLVKLDRASHLVWSYPGNPHHDVRSAPDGTVYVLVAKEGAAPSRPGSFLPPSFRDEGVAVLDRDGQKQRILWLAPAFERSPYVNIFAGLDPGWEGCMPDRRYCWNLFHANSIQIIGADAARHLPFAKPGDLLVNLRELDTVVVLDPQSGDIRWAMRGPWRHAHDAGVTPAGTLTFFDNRGNLGAGDASRVIEIDPATGGLLWSYSGGAEHPFSSTILGTQQMLANGNVLIAESMGGRAFEVTRDGKLVWQYVATPIKGSQFAPEVWGARRIDPAGYPFLAACADAPCGPGPS